VTHPATCAKCGQPEVHVVSVKGKEIASISFGFWKRAPTDHYVCTQCGYVETRIPDRDKLAAIAKKWPLAK
jgi:hypothetical protein